MNPFEDYVRNEIPAPAGEVRITDPNTGGQKGRKPERYDLFPFDALDEVARVYGVGAAKYEDDNWLKGYSWRLSAGALCRHVARFMCGEDRDAETGCHHLAHAAWHCLTLLTFQFRQLGTDDRRPPTEAKPKRPPRTSLFEVGDRVRIRYGVHIDKIGTIGAVKTLSADNLVTLEDGGLIAGRYDDYELERLP